MYLTYIVINNVNNYYILLISFPSFDSCSWMLLLLLLLHFPVLVLLPQVLWHNGTDISNNNSVIAVYQSSTDCYFSGCVNSSFMQPWFDRTIVAHLLTSTMADSADVLHPGDRELSSFNWDLCGPRVRQAMVSHGGRTAFTIKQVYGMYSSLLQNMPVSTFQLGAQSQIWTEVGVLVFKFIIQQFLLMVLW